VAFLVADRLFLERMSRPGQPLSACIDDYPEGIVIPVDKPFRWTSADVIRKLKFAAVRHFHKKNLKVGHAGTLDPLATGVLLVCIGAACRKAEELQRHDKEYIAGIAFGATTPSYDLEKEIDRTFPTDGVSEESLKAVLPSFVGEQEQVAPLFSAKLTGGVRAYELARKLYRTGGDIDGQAAQLLSRQMITISSIELLSFTEGGKAKEGNPAEAPGPQDVSAASSRIHLTDNSALLLPRADIRVACSKGTYIRALARDLGEALGSGAHLDSLQRSRSGDFSVENALDLQEAMSLFAMAPRTDSIDRQ